MKLKKLWMLGIASLLGLTLTGCGSSSQLELQKETFVVEYGETISTNAKDYLVKDTDKEVLKDTKIAIKKLKNEDEQDYAKVGVYKATAKYDKETVNFTIEVKDTVKPKFVDFPEKVEVAKGYNKDITTKFKAEDLSKVTITIDTSKVDFNSVGEYKVKVVATDANKNKAKKDCTIVVKEETEEKQEGTESTNTETNSNAPVINNNTQSNGVVNNNSNNTSSGNTSGGSTGGGNVCVGGTPNPAEIGNSGLLFYGNEEYYAWWDRMLANNWEEFDKLFGAQGWSGWDGWTINFDTCGNPMETIVWTVNFK